MAIRTAQSKEAGRAPLALNSRRDTWWIRPLLTVLVLGGFGLYSTWRAFENQFLRGRALSVAVLFAPAADPFVARRLDDLAAIYILIFPLSFRLTCYYYRLAYYRAFFWDPPACAVPEPAARKRYTGERRFPLRAAEPAPLRFLRGGGLHPHPLLGCDPGVRLRRALRRRARLADADANVALLALYTFSCHSFRHLIGGRVNCYSCTLASRTRYGIWKQVSFLNERHALYAWASLFSVVIVAISTCGWSLRGPCKM